MLSAYTGPAVGHASGSAAITACGWQVGAFRTVASHLNESSQWREGAQGWRSNDLNSLDLRESSQVRGFHLSAISTVVSSSRADGRKVAPYGDMHRRADIDL